MRRHDAPTRPQLHRLEHGVLHRLALQQPDKKFTPLVGDQPGELGVVARARSPAARGARRRGARRRRARPLRAAATTRARPARGARTGAAGRPGRCRARRRGSHAHSADRERKLGNAFSRFFQQRKTEGNAETPPTVALLSRVKYWEKEVFQESTSKDSSLIITPRSGAQSVHRGYFGGDTEKPHFGELEVGQVSL